MHHLLFIIRGRGTVLARLFAFSVFILLMASGAGVAYAKKSMHDGPSSGGYTGPGPSRGTVAQALSMDNQTWVVLKGSVSKNLGGKRYMFTDSTGTIEADIGPKEWAWVGQQISAADTVEIHGHIHSDWKRPYNHVHVKRLIKQ